MQKPDLPKAYHNTALWKIIESVLPELFNQNHLILLISLTNDISSPVGEVSAPLGEADGVDVGGEPDLPVHLQDGNVVVVGLAVITAVRANFNDLKNL